MPAPNVNGLSPSTGSTQGGQSVVISGNHLSNTMSVMFGGVPATYFNIDSDTQITATAPPQAVGTVSVVVTNMTGESSSAGPQSRFTYEANVPVVSAVSPNKGSTSGGELVVITGSGFTGAMMVNFGGVPAWGFTVVSDIRIDAWTPPQADGSVDVQVSNMEGTSAPGPTFTYVSAKPVVTGCDPSVGPTSGGQVVLITGSNFTDVTDVSFGGMPATDFLIESDTQIRATAPPQMASTVDILVTNMDGTSDTSTSSKYTYEAVKPKVTGLLPTSGPAGTQVTIIGENFTNVTAVSFGGLPAQFQASPPNLIVATAPGPGMGTVHVLVTNPQGTSAPDPASEFTYP